MLTRLSGTRDADGRHYVLNKLQGSTSSGGQVDWFAVRATSDVVVAVYLDSCPGELAACTRALERL